MSEYVEECKRKPIGLYRPEFEHDNCGIGAIVNIKGKKTHDTVKNALEIVANLEHRAGKDGEGKTGDGVGILLQISHKFFSKVAKEMQIEIGEEREYGVGMFFFPQDELKRNQAKKMFETIVDDKAVRMGPLPARLRIRGETGGDDGVGAAEGRTSQNPSGHQLGGLGFRNVRQHAGISRDERHGTPSGSHDYHTGAMGQQPIHQ